MKRIVILDGEQKAALAATRAYGREGHEVFVCSQASSSLAGASRYCSGKFKYTSPFEDANRFIHDVLSIVKAVDSDILLPMTDISVFTILKHETLFEGTTDIPLCDFDQYIRASDKLNLVKLAQRLGVAVPDTIFVENLDELDAIKNNLQYPVILKPKSSLILSDGKIHKCGVQIANNHDDLKKTVEKSIAFQKPFMIQEKLTGEGLGIFALYHQEGLVALFAHRRLREKPPWGGVSVLCESTQPDKNAADSAKMLLDSLKWKGVAMVEFKRDGITGMPKLMEINARFWGSLQLSIDSGINFPVLLLNPTHGKPKVSNYKYSRLRWFLGIKELSSKKEEGDIDNLYINTKIWFRSNKKFSENKHLLNNYRDFFCEFLKGSRFEILNRNDLGPFLWECRHYLKNLIN